MKKFVLVFTITILAFSNFASSLSRQGCIANYNYKCSDGNGCCSTDSASCNTSNNCNETCEPLTEQDCGKNLVCCSHETCCGDFCCPQGTKCGPQKTCTQ